MLFSYISTRWRKTVFAIIIITIFFCSFPVGAQATWPVFDIPHTVVSTGNAVSTGTTAGKSIKDTITDALDIFARAAMKLAIRKLTTASVNWINSGFQGNPGFVTDPNQFFLDVADKAASQALSETQLNKLCSPFKAQVRLALVKNYLQDNNNYSCTLDTLKNNYEAFTQDFSQGGWDGWFEMTQTAAGNPYSAYYLAQDSLSMQIGTQRDNYTKQLEQGRGFLSFTKCKPGTEFTQADIDIFKANNMNSNAKVGDCSELDRQIVTPGSVIETQLEGALNTGLKQMELARSFDEIASALITQLFERVLQSGKGLLENNNANDPNNTLPLPEPPIDSTLITLLGPSPTYLQINTTAVYRDPGVIAVDGVDGDITAKVTVTGMVNTALAGTYTITYSVTNSRGETATATRTVVVVNDAPTDPGGGGTVKCTTDPTTGEMTCSLVPTNPTPTGTGLGCAGLGNDSGAPSSIDASNITWIDNGNVGNWPVTTTLDASISTINIRLNYDKASVWPQNITAFDINNPVVGNAWVIVWRNGKWQAATFDWLRPGQTSKGLDNLLGADGSLRGVLGNFSAKAGELYGFAVSGVARNGQSNTEERSNIVSLTWPSGVACPNGTEPTTPETPSTPNPDGTAKIDSISPTIAKPGITTIMISGSNLTNQVSFYDGNGGRNTVVGSVNSSRTLTTVLVPSDQPIGNATVKIYSGNQVWSNGKLISVSNTGTASNIVATTPTTIWQPTQSANNWWPALSPDGRYVSYGNWGESWVTDLQTKQYYDFSKPAGIPVGSRCMAGKWITSDTLTFVCEIGPAENQGRDGFYRYEVKVGEWIVRKTADDPMLVRASQFLARDGHWASQLAVTRIAKDNAVLIADGWLGSAMSMSGNTVVHACTNDNISICVRTGNLLTKTYTAKIPFFQTDTLSGYITYSAYGPVHGITPTGVDTDLTVSPWKVESVVPGNLIYVGNTLWIITYSWEDSLGYSYLFLRPWGSKSVIAVSVDGNYPSIVYNNGVFTIAYATDRGRMTVITVPANSPRTTLQ